MNTIVTDMKYNYNEVYLRKQAWHDKYERLFLKIARALKLQWHEFEINHRWFGGITLGDITFHTDRLYVSVIGGTTFDENCEFFYRRCNGLRDMKGGRTNKLPLKCFHDPALIMREFKRVIDEDLPLHRT